jgi:hypothetical protein
MTEPEKKQLGITEFDSNNLTFEDFEGYMGIFKEQDYSTITIKDFNDDSITSFTLNNEQIKFLINFIKK